MILNGKQSQTLQTLRRVAEAFDGDVVGLGDEFEGEPVFDVRDEERRRILRVSLDEGGRAASHGEV